MEADLQAHYDREIGWRDQVIKNLRQLIGRDPHDKALPEPVFILRAQDKFAPTLIERWAAEVENANKDRAGEWAEKTERKVKEARSLAHEMRAWQALNPPKIPD